MAQSTDSQLTGIKKDIGYLVKKTDKIESLLEKDYVTIDQHQLVVERVGTLQKVVLGFVGLLLAGFATTIINFFLNNAKL